MKMESVPSQQEPINSLHHEITSKLAFKSGPLAPENESKGTQTESVFSKAYTQDFSTQNQYNLNLKSERGCTNLHDLSKMENVFKGIEHVKEIYTQGKDRSPI